MISHPSPQKKGGRAALYLKLGLALWLLFSAAVGHVHGQANDNPTGPSGMFNGNISTGGSYDPYTGNAMRSVTDIVVAGAVGEYPLALTRISNSRQRRPTVVFGGAGAWGHSYSWGLQDSPERNIPISPVAYLVNFPDGRAETFSAATGDAYFRAGSVGERFIPLNTSTLLAYLVLPDGGRVEFKATQHTLYDGENHETLYWYSYVAQALIDTYGLRTSFSYNVDGTLDTITEPAGRSIQLIYRVTPWKNNGASRGDLVIDRAVASDGRVVQYLYGQASYPPSITTYTYLGTVKYYGDPTIDPASYSYTASNLANDAPLLASAYDPMYPGAMKKIVYSYLPAGSGGVAAGQIKGESYSDGSTTTSVSKVVVVDTDTRKETRGDGETRTFTYANALLQSWTDFRGKTLSQTYDSNGFIDSVTDQNLRKTSFTRDPLTGNVLATTYPLTAGDGGVAETSTVTYGSSSCPDSNNRDGNNPYYVYMVKDTTGASTIFTRGTNKRVTRIDYADASYETFTYNSFGEVLSHRMRTGGTETSTYNGRGLKQEYRSPDNAGGNPTARYQYDTLDRVTGVTDALGSSEGDPSHTTNVTYNKRGQILVATLPADPVDGQRHTRRNVYNRDGTVASGTDELNHVTTYQYDAYRRVRSVTPPVRGSGDTATNITSVAYGASATADDYKLTDALPSYVTLPSGKKIHTLYDENRRKISVTAAEGTGDAALTTFEYDDVGNVTSVVMPKEQPGQPDAGKKSIAVYDARNRPKTVTDALQKTTSFFYDGSGRQTKVTRPNGQIITNDIFDALSRVKQQTVTQSPNPAAVSHYTYDAFGMLDTMTDPNGKVYSYDFDDLGRKTKTTYPADSGNVVRTEVLTYDTLGRPKTVKNRNGKTETFTYDALSRQTSATWDDGGLTPPVTLGYDVASRLTSINNANALIARNYFNDNLLRTETTTATGDVPRTVSYTYDADGNRKTIGYPNNSYAFTYQFTGRNQLNAIVDNGNGATVADFDYDGNGSLTGRTLDNNTSSTFAYDALARVTNIVHYLLSDRPILLATGMIQWATASGSIATARATFLATTRATRQPR